jgi:hypothetical protein
MTEDKYGRAHISKGELDEWLTRDIARDPYDRVSAEIILYGSPRLFIGRAYVIGAARSEAITRRAASTATFLEGRDRLVCQAPPG